MSHRLTWRKAGQSEGQLREYLILALLRSGVCAALQDDRLNYLFIANLPSCWSLEPGMEPSDLALFGDEIAHRLADLKARAMETGTPALMEVPTGSDGVYEFHVEAIRSADTGTGKRLMTTIIDLSEERRRETVLRALLRELSHRSKNLLAIIQSIASQTARHSGSLDQFLKKFRGRLYSLSESQDLITDSSWRGAFFRDLLNQQVDKYLPENKHLVVFSGDNIRLSPNASLHIGLALHELIVNAVSHGSLPLGGNAISLTCKVSNTPDGDEIEIRWIEPLSPIAAIALDQNLEFDKHFGSAVLERVVPASVNGTADYAVEKDRILYRLEFPREDSDAI